MYWFQSSLEEARLLIEVTQQSICRSHCLGPASFWLTLLIDWAITQMYSLHLFSVPCIVKLPISCRIPMVSAAHSLTPTTGFFAQTPICWVGIWNALASTITNFGNQKTVHYMLDSRGWTMIEWWISNDRYSKQVLRVLNILSCVMSCGS